jgi:uncharacterized membrane protein
MIQALMAIVAGIFIGGFLCDTRSGFAGAVWGGCFGYLLYVVHHLRQRLDDVLRDVELLRRQQESAPGKQREAAIPAVAPTVKATDLQDSDIVDLVEPVEELFIPDERKRMPQDSIPEFTPLRQTPPPYREKHPVPAPAQPEPVAEPHPAWLARLVSGENLLVKLGVVILFFGVAFLVKYAAQHGLFPLELRLTAAALGGCALLATGWRLRDARPTYAQVIQGGGVGILYLTTFAAMRLYHLIPTVAGFVFLVAICTLAGTLAVLQDARPLAVLGTAGGFLAPELASIGSGSHVMLFSYYAVINAGVIGIAWFRAWRSLNLLGFVCTFIVSALWGGRFYSAAHFASVEPFLVLFFLTYTAVAILFARRQPEGMQGYLDGTLVFGTPIIAFALQAGLVQHFEYGLAWSAFALGLFYIVLAGVLFRKSPATLFSLCDAYLAFGVVFATLAIPLAFDGRWTAAAWGVEGAALVWTGLRQERRLARGFGYCLLIGSGIEFLAEKGLPTGGWPVLNGFYCSCLLVSGAAMFAAYLLRSHGERIESWETGMEALLFAWGMAWWFVSGLHEIHLHTLPAYANGAYLSFIAISCAACGFLRPWLAWPLLDWPAFGLLPAMVAFAAYLLLDGASHPSVHGGYLAWPLAFFVWYTLLKASDDRRPPLPCVAHAAPLWLSAVLVAWECYCQIGHRQPQLATWALTAWGVIPAGLTLLIARRGEDLPWPVSRHFPTYLGLGSGPLVLFGWLWVVCASLTRAGNPWPLPYVPLVNPLDGATLLVMVALAAWYLKVPDALPGLAAELPHRELRVAYGATLFLWLNAILLRSIHHWGGVAFTPDALLGSMLVQTALSIFWSLTALVVMTFATRRGLRPFWIAGATLLGVVVGKLFLVDLSHHGTVERIVSFVAVGLLLLVIGWFAPVPPRSGEGGAA